MKRPLLMSGNLHARVGEGEGFQAQFKSRRSSRMARNGASALADSGSGRWRAAEEGIGRSSAVIRGEGWIWEMDEEGAASGGSVEGEEDDAAAAALKPQIKKSKMMGKRHSNCVTEKRVCYALRPPLPSSDLTNFPVPDEPSSEQEGGGEVGDEEGSEDGIEEGSEDSEEDVPLAQKKVAQV